MNVKKIAALCLTAGMIVTSAACTNNQKQQTESITNNTVSTTEPETKKVEKIEKNIDSVAEKLGLTGGSETLYSMIGATAGKEYNDGNVELYQFDTKSDVYKQIIGEGGPLKAAAYKDGIVLIFPAGTEADSDLIEKFNSIEFK